MPAHAGLVSPNGGVEMPIEQVVVEAEDAPVAVSKYLGRQDVARVTVQDLEGETVLQVPGTSDPSTGAQQVLAALGEPEGGTVRLRVVAETRGVRKGPEGPEGLEADSRADIDREAPLQSPEVGEPEPRDVRR